MWKIMDNRESLLQKMKKLEKEDVLEIVAKEMGTKP